MKSLRLNRLLQVKGRGECQWVECTGEYRVGMKSFYLYLYYYYFILLYIIYLYIKKKLMNT